MPSNQHLSAVFTRLVFFGSYRINFDVLIGSHNAVNDSRSICFEGERIHHIGRAKSTNNNGTYRGLVVFFSVIDLLKRKQFLNMNFCGVSSLCNVFNEYSFLFFITFRYAIRTRAETISIQNEQ